MAQVGDKRRRDPRLSSLGLDARYLVGGKGGDGWRQCRLQDLSLGGALISYGSDEDISVGRRLTFVLERRSDGMKIEGSAEVLRVIERSVSEQHKAARRAALRFVELSGSAASAISSVLNEQLALEGSDDPSEPHTDQYAYDGHTDTQDVASLNGQPLSTLRLHDISLYDLLGLDPSCPNGEIESKCEALIESVMDEVRKAVGKREARLKVLYQSLERMRPLWNDPVKRVRYDLRWGYLRIEERLRDATTGAGPHIHVLNAIWFDLYPDLVREAELIMGRVQQDGLVSCLKKALEVDPFCKHRLDRLAAIESPPEPDEEGPAMPPPGEPPMVRGNLADLPLRVLLRSVAENEDDAEIVVRVNGKAIGVVGVTRGDVVTAISGPHRGLDALRALSVIADGTFQARYSQPRVHLRHMRAPALPLLDAAFSPPTPG